MKRGGVVASSMDMLLDTMCNTFGGVCFIALMVALFSASLPLPDTSENADVDLTESRIVAKEVNRLRQRRDVLRATLEVQQNFVTNATTNIVVKADLLKMLKDVAVNEEVIQRYEKKKIEYLDALARIKTAVAYSQREAARLSRLIKCLEEKKGTPLFDRHRAVRTPKEREIKGLRLIDVWLHERRLYLISDPKSVRMVETGQRGGKKSWDCLLVEGHGTLLDEDFFLTGSVWRRLEQEFDTRSFVRIFTDTVSFNELCLFRDALISRNSKYNWIINESEIIHFVEGYDGRVQ